MANKRYKISLEIDAQSSKKLEKQLATAVDKSLGRTINNLTNSIGTHTKAMLTESGGKQASASQRISNVGQQMEVILKKVEDREYMTHIKSIEEHLEKISKNVEQMTTKGMGGGTPTESDKLQIEQIKLDRAHYDFERQHLSATWRQTSFNERKKLLAMDHQMKMTRMFNRSFLSLLQQGGAIGSVVGAVGNAAMQTPQLQKIQEFLKYQNLDRDKRRLIEQQAMSGTPMGLASANSMLSQEGFKSGIGELMKMQDTWFGKIVKTIGKALPSTGTAKGMAIGGLALGGATLIGMAFKKALDSSPMMQQMLKLWNFGIMLILRPIGDFIGFMLRPIMVWMLRKFIIPWYQDVYPIMKTLGNDIGRWVAEFLDDPLGQIHGALIGFIEWIKKIINKVTPDSTDSGKTLPTENPPKVPPAGKGGFWQKFWAGATGSGWGFGNVPNPNAGTQTKIDEFEKQIPKGSPKDNSKFTGLVDKLKDQFKRYSPDIIKKYWTTGTLTRMITGAVKGLGIGAGLGIAEGEIKRWLAGEEWLPDWARKNLQSNIQGEEDIINGVWNLLTGQNVNIRPEIIVQDQTMGGVQVLDNTSAWDRQHSTG